MRTVLFLCTGNYYRSRFAEIYFNARAAKLGMDWRASSRGLKTDWPGNIGSISVHTQKRLEELGLDCSETQRMPMRCQTDDLESAVVVIALKEAEHRAMLSEHYRGWEDRVRYWHVHDLDAGQPDEALGEIEMLVDELLTELAKQNGSA